VKIGIIGYGVVGRAVAHTMSKRYDVVSYDKFEEHANFSELLDSDFIFITVPTPFNCEKNKVDDSAIVESLDRLQGHNYSNIVIIKSTLPPESCDKYCNIFDLIITYNPEFLRESTSPNEDFENQETIVIGSVQSSHFKRVKKMYEKVAISEAKYFHMTLLEAEMVKYAQNTMLASRVALANMIFDACEEHGIEYNEIRKIAFDRLKYRVRMAREVSVANAFRKT